MVKFFGIAKMICFSFVVVFHLVKALLSNMDCYSDFSGSWTKLSV